MATNNEQIGYGLYAEWVAGKRENVIRALAETPRFDAVLQVVEMLRFLDNIPGRVSERTALLDALEQAAQTYPGEPLAVSWAPGTQ